MREQDLDSRKLIPNHNNCNHSHSEKHGQEPVKWGVKVTLILGPEPFGNEVVDGHVNKDPAGEAHGYGVDPVCYTALSRSIDRDAYSYPHRARDSKGQGVAQGEEERPLWEHPE